MRKIFIGSDGIRIGWRLLIFSAVLVAVIITFQHIAIRLPGVGKAVDAMLKGQFGPLGGLLNELIQVGSLLIALGVMTKIERRRISDYGWRPQRAGAPTRWVIGLLFGVAMVAAMYTLQWAEHVYSFGSIAIPFTTALWGGAAWAAGCFLVGIFEEGVCRGYAQFTLGRGIGFWPAAFVISVAFGFLHLLNPNYTVFGAGGAAIFGLLFAFCLWRTGDLWLAVGIHAAVDFAEFFLFAPAHSFPSSLHLLSADLHGPAWLTGWTIGPEASVNGYVVIAVAFLVIWAATRRKEQQHRELRS